MGPVTFRCDRRKTLHAELTFDQLNLDEFTVWDAEQNRSVALMLKYIFSPPDPTINACGSIQKYTKTAHKNCKQKELKSVREPSIVC